MKIASTPKLLLSAGFSVYLLAGLVGNCWAQVQIATDEQPIPLHAELSPGPSKAANNAQYCQWESRKYPIITWKVHPITTAEGVSAQLKTTFNTKRDMFGRGTMKYTFTVSEIPKQSPSLKVQLLDKNGFKLTEFEIARERFHPIPGTKLMEAADEHLCTKREYKRACDYVVM